MKIDSLRTCIYFIKCDAYRHLGTNSFAGFLKLYLLKCEFRYVVWMRLCTYLYGCKILYPFYVLALIRLNFISYFTGIQISHTAPIGEGFYISHFGTIRVGPLSSIGRNVNISPGVFLGKGNRGPNKGLPQVGNNVYIAPGAKLVGNVHIGDYACIGANAVVTHDVPEHACVGGVPARIISMEGSEGYVNHTV